jgi:hypothetical protein
MRLTSAWIVAACFSTPAWAWAGQDATPAPPATGDEHAAPLPPAAVDAPAHPREPDTEVTVGPGTRLVAGVGFSHPLGAAARVGILHGLAADVREEDGRVRAVCAVPIPHCAQGFLFELEAGSGGGKVSVGLGARAQVDEEDFRGTVGFGLRLSLARTWGSPFGTDPGLTFLGPELDVSIRHVDLGLGVLWRVSGRPGPAALFSWRVGFGL